MFWAMLMGVHRHAGIFQLILSDVSFVIGAGNRMHRPTNLFEITSSTLGVIR
jgi:hypothetical protein